MKEFGSDFHYIEPHNSGNTLLDYYPKNSLYSNGRQAINALIRHQRWKRIWMPDYFCHEITDSIRKTGIQICFYPDNPLSDDRQEIGKLTFEADDVLFRVNYFGLRAFRCNLALNIPVIEDHSHDLLGNWAIHSNAEWCVASLRKTLPIPEGGILWSPNNRQLPEMPKQSAKNLALAEKRWAAMRLKKKYLENKTLDKNEFRKLFIETEDDFNKLRISPLTKDCKAFLNMFDIVAWYRQKQHNWNSLSKIQSDKVKILKRETEACNNFSLILLFQDSVERNKVRNLLIADNIYPAILWIAPEHKPMANDIGNRVLSIACDGRYSSKDIITLKNKLESILKHV